MTHDPATIAAQFEFLFQHTATAILLIDRDGALIRYNPAAASLLALGADAAGQPVSALVDEHPGLRHALRRDTPPADELVTLGNHRATQLRSTQFEDGSRLILLQDVSMQGAMDAGRAALIRRVAHDLRNPVNALSGFADLAATEPCASPEQTEYLKTVQRIAEKLHSLAGTLVDLAWIESGMPLERQPAHLGAIIEAAVSDLADTARRHDSAIALDLAPDLQPVLGDAARLREAIGAVLQNALLYAPNGAAISVRAWNHGPEVRCAIQDRGFGLAPEDAPKAFDRLWRSLDPRVQAIPGGGVGLTLARAVIRRHQGRIALESEAGAGTTVTLALPAAGSR